MSFKQGEFPIEERFWIAKDDIAVNVDGFLFEKNPVTIDPDQLDKINDFLIPEGEVDTYVPYRLSDPMWELQQKFDKLEAENIQMKLAFSKSFQGFSKRLDSIEGATKAIRDNVNRMMGGQNGR